MTDHAHMLRTITHGLALTRLDCDRIRSAADHIDTLTRERDEARAEAAAYRAERDEARRWAEAAAADENDNAADLRAARATLEAVRAYADYLATPATLTGTPSEPSRWLDSPKMKIADELRDVLLGGSHD